MIIKNLSEQNSLVKQFLAEIRNVDIQKDSLRFRRNVERIGEIMAYEISKTLGFKETDIQTPLGIKPTSVLSDKIVVASILRAGLPFHQGFLNYFDQAENAYIAAYRKHTVGDEFEISLEYISTPDLTDKVLLLVDPMLATAWSMEKVYKAILKYGKPAQVHLAAVISAQPGLEYIQKEFAGENITLWTADIDPELDSKSYIIPGLGDAGDLAFGEKL
ncbi:MAG: uracil phosphoribosyltransferase [Bacteroidetes bacterium]|nr:uracil phosphoribosyltransferase [Bacteroidota bacterium]